MKIVNYAQAAVTACCVLISMNAAVGATPQPKITAAQAKAAAVAKISGTPLSAKYEHEDGRWQYAVLVKRGNSLYEVEVSATGKVLDTERTSLAEERSEATADAHALKAHK